MAEITETTTPQSGNGQTAPIDIVDSMAVAEVAIELTKIRAALAEAQANLVEIKNTSAQVLAIKTKVEDHQTVVATKSAHIEDAQKHGDKVRGELDRELTTAKQQAIDAENQKVRAQTAADDLVKIVADIQAAKGTADTNGEGIAAVLKMAEESASKTQVLADKSATIEARIIRYETRLAELEAEGVSQLKTIEGLLPGAASAGLASSFGERRETFSDPQRKWENWFVGSLVAVFILAAIGFVQLHLMATPTWDQILAFWLMRAPLALPLVWLAIHASREVALGKRLEEDYGYKAAISTCFEGFRKQMTEIAEDVKPEHPLTKLCDDTLKTIASPPGRIYEKHRLTTTPADQFADIARLAKESVTSHLPNK